MPEGRPPSLAAVHFEQGQNVDAVLSAAARQLQQDGFSVGGVVQSTAAPEDGCCAEMCLIDLRTNEAVAISQDLGRHSRGCRLDRRGLAEVATSIDEAIASGVDLVVINRFGIAETEGQGLMSCFANAVEAGVPVLTAVRPPYHEGWRAFHGGLAVDLDASAEAIVNWRRGLAATVGEPATEAAAQI